MTALARRRRPSPVPCSSAGVGVALALALGPAGGRSCWSRRSCVIGCGRAAAQAASSSPRVLRQRRRHAAAARGSGHDVAARDRSPPTTSSSSPGSSPRPPTSRCTRPTGAVGRPRGSTARRSSISPRRWGQRRDRRGEGRAVQPWAGLPLGAGAPASDARSRCCRHDRGVRRAGERPAADRADRRAPVRREGDGTEFSSIRPFHSGDRMRRINWRVSLRTGALHVVSTRVGGGHRGPAPDRRRAGRLRRLAGASTATSPASTSRCGRPRRSPSSTSGRATGCRCAWSAPAASTSGTAPARRHLRRILGQLARDPARRPARRGGRADRLPDRRRHHGGGAQPDALRRHGDADRPAAAAGPAGDRGRHPARGRRAVGVVRHRPGDRGAGLADAADRAAATCWSASPRPAARWCRGAARAPSRRCVRRLARRAQLPRAGAPVIARSHPAAGGRCALVIVARADWSRCWPRSPQGYAPPSWVVVVVAVFSFALRGACPSTTSAAAALAHGGGLVGGRRPATVLPLASIAAAAALLAAHLAGDRWRRTVRRGWLPTGRPSLLWAAPRRAALGGRAGRLARGRRRRRARHVRVVLGGRAGGRRWRGRGGRGASTRRRATGGCEPVALDHEQYVELVLRLRRAGAARPGHDVRRDRGGGRAGRRRRRAAAGRLGDGAARRARCRGGASSAPTARCRRATTSRRGSTTSRRARRCDRPPGNVDLKRGVLAGRPPLDVEPSGEPGQAPSGRSPRVGSPARPRPDPRRPRGRPCRC